MIGAVFSPEGFGVRLPYALLAHNYMRATPSPLCATPCFGIARAYAHAHGIYGVWSMRA